MRAYYRLGGTEDWIKKPKLRHTTIRSALVEQGCGMSYLYVYDQDQELIAALFLGEELAEIEQTARYGPDYWTNIAQELEKVLTGYLGRIKCVTS